MASFVDHFFDHPRDLAVAESVAWAEAVSQSIHAFFVADDRGALHGNQLLDQSVGDHMGYLFDRGVRAKCRQSVI